MLTSRALATISIILTGAFAIGFSLAAAPPRPVAGSATLFGPLCSELRPPGITGPHRLVRLEGMGNDRWRVDTASSEAQAWFDYGLALARSFEHGDATLAFERAAQADAACSMCLWGVAWSRGPTINFSADAAQAAANLQLARQAQRLAAAGTTPVMRSLQLALVDRYAAADPAAGNLAYAQAMDALNRADPEDVELAIFDAEAWLIRLRDKDASGLQHAVDVLQRLLPGNPDHSGLLHFYVHATEEAGQAQLAESLAHRVAELAPRAAHMVHMPSHTLFRVGRYREAAQYNLEATRVARQYAEATNFPTPLGGLQYHFHNIYFGVAAAMMSGEGNVALQFMRQFNRDFPDPAHYNPRAEQAAGLLWAAFGRFATPELVLQTPDSAANSVLLSNMRHYARGDAWLRLGNLKEARNEAGLMAMAADAPPVAAVARDVLRGRIEMQARRPALAEAHFRAAAQVQDTRLAAFDPPRWPFPVHRCVAASLLAQGDAVGAQREVDGVLLSWKRDPVSMEIRARARRLQGDGGWNADHVAAMGMWQGQQPLSSAAEGCL